MWGGIALWFWLNLLNDERCWASFSCYYPFIHFTGKNYLLRYFAHFKNCIVLIIGLLSVKYSVYKTFITYMICKYFLSFCEFSFSLQFYLFFCAYRKFGPFHCWVAFCFMDMSYIVYHLPADGHLHCFQFFGYYNKVVWIFLCKF